MDIDSWLGELGLAQYVNAFADNDIDAETLVGLTNEDLKELGVTSLGHRKKLLAAIASLSSESGPTLGSANPAQSAEAASPPYSTDAERRQLTVMFCDLVGSTSLSEKLDPEDLREIIRSYQETCAESVSRYEGRIAKYIGDGILVYFGYPQAHEDDARRAVSAGLGIVVALESLNRRLSDSYGVELNVRIGIHTGLVVVGEMGVAESREAEAIVGETPNVAARLEGIAAPNSVAISAATHGLVDGLFECKALGPQRLKGVSKPVRIFQVHGESPAPSRFEAAAEQALVPITGRDAEVGLLLERWAQVKEGEAQVVLLSGEAGIGKSRIVRGFRERVASQPHHTLTFYGSAYHRNSALYPVIDQLERALRFTRGDGPAEKLDKLEVMLQDVDLDVVGNAPVLASLLSLPAKEHHELLDLDAQQLKARTLEAIISVIGGMAAQAPVFMAVEDAHWIDPSMVEFLSLAIDHLSSARVLLLITFRPEFEPPWVGHAQVTAHMLNRLSRKDATAMVTKVIGDRVLPTEVLEQIVAKTGGVPLYVEELTKSVLESGLLEEIDGGYALTGSLPPLAIPASLQDSLMARLDRLGPVKGVAQLASVLGRTFTRELLAAVSPLSAGDLDNALARLVESELIYLHGLAPDVTYEFKHALVGDAAYHSLLKRTRQHHHGCIAQVLVEQFPKTAESQPELLAHHFTEAGLVGQAIPHWQQAAERATKQSANLEAIAHLTKGLELLRSLPNTLQRAKQELVLQIALMGPLIAAKGYTVPETEHTYARALKLCNQIGDTPEIFPVLYGPQVFALSAGSVMKAHKLAEEFLNLADSQQDDALRMVGHRMLGMASLTIGKPTDAQKHVEKAIALYQPERHRPLTFLYGQDVKVAALSGLHWSLWLLGYPDQALERSQDALDEAQALSHVNTLCYALSFAGILHALRGDGQSVQHCADTMLTLSAKHKTPVWAGFGRCYMGRELVRRGQIEDGLEMLQEGIRACQALRLRLWTPTFFTYLGEAFGASGQFVEALKALDEAQAVVDQSDERWFEAEVHRVRGEVLLRQSVRQVADAEVAFQKALDTARGQEAKSFELRAATSLARMRQSQKRIKEARDLLASIYGWFAEGFDTADLKETKALLDELS